MLEKENRHCQVKPGVYGGGIQMKRRTDIISGMLLRMCLIFGALLSARFAAGAAQLSDAIQDVERFSEWTGDTAQPAAEPQNGTQPFGQGHDEASEGGDNLPGEQPETVSLDESWTWASNSAVHSGSATLYRAGGSLDAPGRKNLVVCVNAGHGTASGSNYETLSHPDGTPKVTGGTTAQGAVYSTAVSSGMTFADGTSEASANLMTALALKNMLLKDGYDVLMIRESDDVQLDNIARTVIANHSADIHVAIHFDYTQSDKGVYFCAVPDDASYRQMEPVASHWQEHMALGQALIQGMTANGFWLFGDGTLPMDLTQTSYSTIPSVDIEIGDAASAHSPEDCERYAQGLKDGIDLFFQTR